MAMFHVSVDRIVKGQSDGGATGFAHYIARQQMDHATQHARYLTRASHPERHDLVAAGHAHLPAWAHEDPAHFFTMADRYERQGGIVGRTWEMALPRELTPVQRQELADDIRATFFHRHPHAWALHNPVARDGGEQPHLHVLVNERVMDGIDRSAQRFFRRAATQGRDPADGGARKDLSWNWGTRVMELRAGCATLTNAALERHGHAVSVSHETLRARGHDRAPEVDQGGKARYLHARRGIETRGWQETLAQRAVLHRDYLPFENELNRDAWRTQQQREHLHDLSREAVIDHVRARFWAHDHSLERRREREQALMRALDREYARGQERQHTRHHERGQTHGLSLDDIPAGGLHVHIHAHDLEMAR